MFVHDVDRVAEDKFSKAFLCDRTRRANKALHYPKPQGSPW